jgi:hypothetical protein
MGISEIQGGWRKIKEVFEIEKRQKIHIYIDAYILN